MKITAPHFLIIILLYPLFYCVPFIAEKISYAFSLYYFFAVTIILFIININSFKIKIDRYDFINLMIIVLLLIVIIINTNDIRYSKPLFFFIFLINFYLLSNNLKIYSNKAIIISFLAIYILFSFIFIFDSSRYMEGDRYNGFLSSATVYSVYLEVLLILYIFYSKNIFSKILIFFVIGGFILLTKTRLNLIFYLFIPYVTFCIKKVPSSRTWFTVILIIALNFTYIIYDFLLTTPIGESIVASRYSDGRDASFGLRHYLFGISLNEYLYNLNVLEMLFGKGSEYARMLIIETLGSDEMPHNDFLRFTLDFGLVGTLLYLFLLFRISKNNNIAFCLFLLYLFSFYHNMIYDFFLISLIIFFSKDNYQVQFNEVKKDEFPISI